MPYKIFDFYCNNGNCMSYQVRQEQMLHDSEWAVCEICGETCKRDMANPKGYVKGTETPCKQ